MAHTEHTEHIKHIIKKHKTTKAAKAAIITLLCICGILFYTACSEKELYSEGTGTNDAAATATKGMDNMANTDSIQSGVPGENPAPTPEPVIPDGAARWINAAENPDIVIMTEDQISEMNRAMLSRCDALKNLKVYPQSLTKEEITDMIEDSSGPSLPKYDDKGNEITQTELADIKANRNIEALADTSSLKKGVTVQRTDIRALPTEREFYNTASVQDHDRMQESELSAASAVWVIHESLDGKFFFIQSHYYTGWVNADNIAIADGNSDWEAYAGLLNMDGSAFQREDFAVITDSQITVNGVRLDMGTALLIDDSTQNDSSQHGSEAVYKVILPGRDKDGTLTRVSAEIPVQSANEGYLAYNLRNFYIQAFKYTGTPYGWGGMKNGVDCSSYVLKVFKSFGFVFPRNTGQQNKAVGNITDVEGRDDAYKLSVLSDISKDAAPVIIYKSGHAMIYLGIMDNVHYIIHAPGGGNVCEAAYDGFSSLIRICEVSSLK